LGKILLIGASNNSENIFEPMIFQTPFGQRPDQFPPAKAHLLNHQLGLQEITRVEVISPMTTNASPELQAVIDSNQIKLHHGTDHRAELGFDDEQQGQSVDLRPTLPLQISW
jgi:hypothetical protein